MRHSARNGQKDRGQEQMQRFIWSPDMHQRFVVAVGELGLDDATPQHIMNRMDLHGEHAPWTGCHM